MSSRAPSGAYYNEIDGYAAQWLRNLIAAGLIPAGDVDERSIVDVQADDVRGYAQCHWFAGLGGWARALRLAGWPDGRPVWTGSCPCQPFSVAGRGGGFADERHLWPEFYRLIRECRPVTVMGEQVAGRPGLGWLDGVFADLEGSGYACGAAVVPACGVGAPHRRERLWFVADAGGGGFRSGGSGENRGQAGAAGGEVREQRLRADAGPAGGGGHGPLADADQPGARDRHGERGGEQRGAGGDQEARALVDAASERRGEARAEHELRGGRPAAAGAGGAGGVMGHPNSPRPQEPAGERGDARAEQPAAVGAGGGGPLADANSGRRIEAGRDAARDRAPTGGGEAGWHSGGGAGFWSDALWLTGADGKSRRVGSGLRLLAHGIPARVAKLRALGNAIVPQVAAEVIRAYMETVDG